jgi:hypothetical protein
MPCLTGNGPLLRIAIREVSPLATLCRVTFPLAPFGRYRVALQRKKCCQQIIGFDDESFSVAGPSTQNRNPCWVKCSAMP